MFATGVVDYAMGSYLQKIYLQQPAAPAAPAGNGTRDGGSQPG